MPGRFNDLRQRKWNRIKDDELPVLQFWEKYFFARIAAGLILSSKSILEINESESDLKKKPFWIVNLYQQIWTHCFQHLWRLNKTLRKCKKRKWFNLLNVKKIKTQKQRLQYSWDRIEVTSAEKLHDTQFCQNNLDTSGY